MSSTKIRSSTQIYVDADFSLGTHKLTNVTDPSAAQDAATKAYVDSKIQGVEWQDSVIDKDTLTPPGSPSTGDRYIINGVGTGAWAGHDYEITEWNGTAWIFTAVREGLAAWVQDENLIYVYNGSAWVVMAGVTNHNSLNGLQGGTTNEYYHLTSAQHTDLTDGGDCTSHTHAIYLPLAGGTMTGDITMAEDGHIGLTNALIHFNSGSAVIEVNNDLSVGADLYVTGAITQTNGPSVLARSVTSAAAGSKGLDVSYTSTNSPMDPWYALYSEAKTGGNGIGIYAKGTSYGLKVESTGTTAIYATGKIESAVTTGTAPFTIASTTVSTNLNSDLLDGLHSSSFIQGTNYVTREVPSGTKNGSNVTFTLANTPVSGTEQLYLNGILQNAGSGNDYTISTNTITMEAAPAATDVLLCTYLK